MKYRVVLQILGGSAYVARSGGVSHAYVHPFLGWIVQSRVARWEDLGDWFMETSTTWLAENPEPVYIECRAA